MKTLILALLDKSNPPDHSFVNGMLSNVLASEPDISVSLIVSKNSIRKQNYIFRYFNAICIPKLFIRRGVFRFLNFFVVLKLLFCLILRAKKRKKNIILFVRNDPIFLLASSLLKPFVSKIIFQNSFPHEKNSKGLKSSVAKFIYKLCAPKIDSIISVSPLGEERLRHLFPSVSNISHIPLLAEKIVFDKKKINDSIDKKLLDFIYIGSHDRMREINIILDAIVHAVKDLKVKARFSFVGATKIEIDQYLLIQGVQDLVAENIIFFKSKVQRSQIWDYISDADIGFCLIPPKDIYIEASPTKLAEYLSCGLAVIANREILLQEKVISISKAGVLTEFNSNSIAIEIMNLTQDRQKLKLMRLNAISYSKNSFSYASYLERFRAIILDL
ncbi:MAG: glycosyltransferase [Flavobacteriaceae bacterium]|nr:glycosyltransferase [Flavobacteriaceae bacterium]